MIYLVTFHSHFDAILTNRTLKSAGIEVRLMPIPRSLSSSCGTCVVFRLEKDQRAPEHTSPPVGAAHIYRQGEMGWELIR